MATIKWHTTNFPNIIYFEHATRRHGAMPDRRYYIRHRVNGKRIDEPVGWASEGWTPKRAAALLGELEEAKRTGKGSSTLKERQALAAADRDRRADEAARAAAEGRTFADYFVNDYLPRATADKKPGTVKRERETLARWAARDIAIPFPGWEFLGHDIGAMAMKDATPFDIERIKKAMRDAGRAPRTIQYCIGLVRHVFRKAIKDGVIKGPSPTDGVELPKFDNARLRRLDPEQIDALLHHLRHGIDYTDKTAIERRIEGSDDVADMALLALHCGLRLGECFSLTWADVDVVRGTLHLRDTKNASTRTAYLTPETVEIFQRRRRGAPNELVFPVAKGTNKGRTREFLSATFARVVEALHLNDGICDRRQRFVFHSLRHEFASRLADNGASPFIIQKLLGHKTPTMALRYAHLADDTLRTASLAAARPKTKTNVIDINARRS